MRRSIRVSAPVVEAPPPLRQGKRVVFILCGPLHDVDNIDRLVDICATLPHYVEHAERPVHGSGRGALD